VTGAVQVNSGFLTKQPDRIGRCGVRFRVRACFVGPPGISGPPTVRGFRECECGPDQMARTPD